jgi:Transposase DDE domain group 1
MQSARCCIVILLRHGSAQKNLHAGDAGLKMRRREAYRSELLCGDKARQPQCATIRLKLLKIGALIRISVRKVWVSLAGGYPYVALFEQVRETLRAVPLKC